MKVEFYRHSLDETDRLNLHQVLESVFLTTGPVTGRFEDRFKEYTGLKHVVGLSSGTAALHLALLALGLGPGDEVITTPMTFIASVNVIMHVGATPVMVDVEKKTGLIDPDLVRKAITPHTKAILPVHLYGSLCDMKALHEIADQHELKIVEDCAHCIEGERDGVRPGHLGNAACYSFYATKNLTCGEGGVLAANDSDLAARVRLLRQHGMSKEAADRYTGKYQHWDMTALGWKYNMDDIRAALLINQLDRLDSLWDQRNKLAEIYDEGLKNCPGLEIPAVPGKGARHLYTVWVDPDRRDEIVHRVQEAGIGVTVNYRAIHTLTFYRERFGYRPDDFPVAYEIGQRTISLPFYPKLTTGEIQYVIDSLKHIVSTPRS